MGSALFRPRQIPSNSEEITFQGSLSGIELSERPSAHRIENHNKYILRKLFSNHDGPCHVHQKSVNCTTVLIIEVQECVFISSLQTLDELSV